MTELGLSPTEFWALTWYEWGLCVMRIIKEQRKRQEDRELNIELTRSMMSLLANINRDPKKTPFPYKPEDFFKLSYDTRLNEEIDPDLFGKVARRLGSSIKNKSGDE